MTSCVHIHILPVAFSSAMTTTATDILPSARPTFLHDWRQPPVGTLHRLLSSEAGARLTTNSLISSCLYALFHFYHCWLLCLSFCRNQRADTNTSDLSHITLMLRLQFHSLFLLQHLYCHVAP